MLISHIFDFDYIHVPPWIYMGSYQWHNYPSVGALNWGKCFSVTIQTPVGGGGCCFQSRFQNRVLTYSSHPSFDSKSCYFRQGSHLTFTHWGRHCYVCDVLSQLLQLIQTSPLTILLCGWASQWRNLESSLWGNSNTPWTETWWQPLPVAQSQDSSCSRSTR